MSRHLLEEVYVTVLIKWLFCSLYPLYRSLIGFHSTKSDNLYSTNFWKHGLYSVNHSDSTTVVWCSSRHFQLVRIGADKISYIRIFVVFKVFRFRGGNKRRCTFVSLIFKGNLLHTVSFLQLPTFMI